MKLTRLFNDFFHSEKSGGIVLIACTVLSIVLTNSGFQSGYLSIWNFEIADHSVTHWINDGLMAIFFLLIGLELEREVYIGELSSLTNSLLPIFAAIGGMLVPAGIHFAINSGTPTQPGAGIPMATDIAFALGVLSLFGRNVPPPLKIFLTALAVIDDLGAILVIAIFYTGSLTWLYLLGAFGVLLFLFLLNRLKIYNLVPYLVGGIIMWYFMLHSGIHATITGVLLAFVIPFGNGSEKSPSFILQNFLHKPVAFIILPLFAMANTCLVITPNWYQVLLETNSLGIILGLLAGKPIGITLFSYLSVKLKISSVPEGLNFKKILGAGFLGGIGFTMSIFITLLAFSDTSIIEQSKIAIMLASMIAGAIGFMILKVAGRFNKRIS
ncbi:MAG TPA: Na+/H+ antiporter NhaA [Cyclobacteriaceae bacterium]|nr:Na+/H+ antiporter NhaA [Cyclobacteriaceae bacterium]HMX88019.1 Na+/H+ antiporter NhaA [Saprospiraceae bacterium]HMX00853.1 Na+/H+ antiporter NhaA [Cyclobacteriaceae bacterium]HMY93657.1 Na+/H+ antiporter NhaA [Cyclobacteriaceae bacterium]HNA12909.1 Na+/H+ antiporter NhaA [Cyclobacteriaceae bacterium]